MKCVTAYRAIVFEVCDCVPCNSLSFGWSSSPPPFFGVLHTAVFSIETKLQTGPSAFRISVETRDFFLLEDGRTGCGAHLSSYMMGKAVISRG